MLKKLLLTLVLLWQSNTQAQYIQNINVTPLYPGPVDSVRVLIDLQFNSGDCALAMKTHTVGPDSIRIEVYHCPGPLAFICDVTDTINLGLLQTGTYYTEVIVHEKIYSSADPCAGSNPADSSNLQLTVFPGSNVISIEKNKSFAYYRYQTNELILSASNAAATSVLVFDVRGSLILKQDLGQSNRLKLPVLSNGVYLYKYITADGTSSSGKFSVNK